MFLKSFNTAGTNEHIFLEADLIPEGFNLTKALFSSSGMLPQLLLFSIENKGFTLIFTLIRERKKKNYQSLLL
jgi:hypothetical protein